ncbi:MAG TPA: hypothetical protein VFW71_01080 [Actinomycetota bacterium]|nr:hypothetical protein [Actinomycetota bacterium]
MRTSTLATSYIQAVIFGALAGRCLLGWFRERDRRSAHLAWAAGLFGVTSLLGAITSTIYDSTKGQTAPRWETIIAGAMMYLAIYAFLLFLADFIRFPRWVRAFFLAATGVNVVLAFIERPDLRFDGRTSQIVSIPGIHNPINYRTYLGYILAYLAVSLGLLTVAFLAYAFRTAGLARLRMLLIGSGFLLLCVVVGLLPRLLFGHPSAQTISHLLTVLQYVALVAGPLLLVGFAPPTFLKNLFRRAELHPKGPQQAPAV